MPKTTLEMLLKRKTEREALFPASKQSTESKTPKERLDDLQNTLFGPDYIPSPRGVTTESSTEPAMLRPRSRASKRKHYCFKPPRP